MQSAVFEQHLEMLAKSKYIPIYFSHWVTVLIKTHKLINRHQNATKDIDFARIRRGLQYIASKNFVSSPKRPLEVVEAFNLQNVWESYGLSQDVDDQKHFFTACINEEDFAYCIFSSQKSIKLIEENILPVKRTFLMDATFKIVPRGCFTQLLVIYIEYMEEVRKPT